MPQTLSEVAETISLEGPVIDMGAKRYSNEPDVVVHQHLSTVCEYQTNCSSWGTAGDCSSDCAGS